eukprot:5708153-Pyramimonas_sp.AAC.1
MEGLVFRSQLYIQHVRVPSGDTRMPVRWRDAHGPSMSSPTFMSQSRGEGEKGHVLPSPSSCSLLPLPSPAF